MSDQKKHDIFFSYARDDRERVRPIVNQLEQDGLTVWWDENIPPGVSWPIFLRENLDASRVVVVAWSETSVKKDFVIDEANVGKKADCLIPIFIDEVDPPLGFGGVQATKLINWNGKENKEWEKFRRAIEEKMEQSQSKAAEKADQSEKAWRLALQTNTPEGYYSFLEKHWHSPHAREALQKIKSLEKKKETKSSTPTPGFSPSGLRSQTGQYRPGSTLGQTQLPLEYWTNRLKGISPSPAQVAKAAGSHIEKKTTSNSKEFVFYQSPAFYIALIILPTLGLAGAWLTDFALSWCTQQFDVGEYYFQLPDPWLYVAGVIWGVVYLLYGIIEASEMDDWMSLYSGLILPYDNFSDTMIGTVLTALPFNLILAWGITFAGSYFLNIMTDLYAIIALAVLTTIQVIVYFGLDG